MKTIYNTISRIGFLAVVGFSGILTSCDNDFDFDEARRENPEFVYRENFEKHFGAIDPNQSWDFTDNKPVYGTRAETITVTDGQSATFSKTLRDNIKNFLKDGADNTTKGHAYVLISQGPFDIYPLYRGRAMEWDLYINDSPTPIATYSQIMTKMNQNPAYGLGSTSALTTTGWHIDLPIGTPILLKLKITKSDNATGWYACNKGDYAIEGDIITSFYNPEIPYKNGNLKNGSLAITDKNELKNKGIDNQNIDMLIMFEDSKTRNGDGDFNDFVIGIKGRTVPPLPVDVKENEGKTTYENNSSITKRYMVEDLGAVDKSDIDFNDIVIDFEKGSKEVHEVKTITKEKYQNGVLIGKEETITDEIISSTSSYSATVRALGGTKNISVFLGNALNNVCIFTKDQYGDPDGNRPSNVTYNSSYSNPANLNIGSGTTASVMYNTFNGNKTYKGVTDKKYDTNNAGSVIATINLNNLPAGKPQWNPSTNNIFVKVYHTEKTTQSSGSQSAESTKTIEFPANGQIPYMIAVDTDQAWNKERVSVFDLTDSGNYLKLTNNIPSSN